MITDENKPEYQVIKARNIAGLILFINEKALNEQNIFTANQIKTIHRQLMDGLLETAGQFRKQPVALRNSDHTPPPSESVEDLTHTMCATVTKLTQNGAPLTLIVAYVLWRFNWIHPFENGNGRTARILGHYIIIKHIGTTNLSTLLETELAKHRSQYFETLAITDGHYEKTGQINLTDLKKLIARCFVAMFKIN